jgi:hypothetical protein
MVFDLTHKALIESVAIDCQLSIPDTVCAAREHWK